MVLIKKTIKIHKEDYDFFNDQPKFNFSGLVRGLVHEERIRQIEYMKQIKGK